MKKRLSKALAAAGVASRRASETLIFKGRVSVNREVIRVPQTLVDPENDHITVDGKQIHREEKKLYFILNKPIGYLCTCAPDTKNVLRFFSHLPQRLFPVGRLDRDTSGLLLMTNDGAFANRVIHPSFNVKKEYLAKTLQEITPAHLKALCEGTVVENRYVRPVSVKKVRKGTVKIVVSEGKKHEVRLLLAHAKLDILELTRIRIGALILGQLPVGAYRELTEQEREFFSY